VTWPGVFLVLLVSHLVGDVLLQTETQAVTKAGGFGDGAARRALLRHVSVYMLAFVPALIWIATQRTPVRAVTVGVLVAVPHLIIDDGRPVRLWLREVKGVDRQAPGLAIAVDQCLHVLCLFGVALIAQA
jgi:hypothetical protein